MRIWLVLQFIQLGLTNLDWEGGASQQWMIVTVVVTSKPCWRCHVIDFSLSSEANTVRCHYNAVNFLQNIHKRHNIAHPSGRGMGCLLWVQSLIDILPQFLQMMCAISCYVGLCYNVTLLYCAFDVIWPPCFGMKSWAWCLHSTVRCHYNAVNFLQIPHNRETFHSSPMRVRYGVSFVNLKSDLYSALISAVVCEISWYPYMLIQ